MSDMPEKIWAAKASLDVPGLIAGGAWYSKINYQHGEVEYIRGDIAEAEIESLRRQVEASQWVPVEDRLPDEGDLVLVTNYGFLNKKMPRYYCTGYVSNDGKWRDSEQIEIYAPDYWTPIRPLPAKGEQ